MPRKLRKGILQRRRKASEATVARGLGGNVLLTIFISVCIFLFHILQQHHSYSESAVIHEVVFAILFGAALGWLDWYVSIRFIRSGRGLESEID
jgi:hypothetical protein